MSSTSRGYTRHEKDYYRTPINAIELFIKEFSKHEKDAFTGLILDPSAGGDNQYPMSYPTAILQIISKRR